MLPGQLLVSSHIFRQLGEKLVIVSILPNLISKTELRDETGDS